jgi:hypothetical protein
MKNENEKIKKWHVSHTLSHHLKNAKRRRGEREKEKRKRGIC